jgi:hypothetical protein
LRGLVKVGRANHRKRDDLKQKETTMCKVFALTGLLACTLLFAETSLAAVVSIKATVAQVRNACSRAGGTFSVDLDGKGYGCSKANCNGKGGTCHVRCDNNNNCVGATPARVSAAVDLMTILSGGVAVQTTKNPSPGGILEPTPALGLPRPAATGRPAPN